MIAELFINIFASILYDRGKQGLGRYFTESPAEKAISLTADDFPSLIHVRDALNKWCKSGELATQVDALQEGYDEGAIEEAIVDSFINVGKFYDNVTITDTPKTARRVLESFLRHLEEEISKTDLWSVIKERRDRRRYRELGAQIRNQTDDIKAAVRDTIAESFPPFDLDSSPQVREKIHFATVDFAVELLKEGKAKSARARLEGLRVSVATESPSVDLIFRIAANLGSCALQLDDLETARREYETALVLKPEHRLVLSYAAIVAMVSGNGTRALEYARRSRPAGERDPQITSNYLRVLNSAGLTEEIGHLIEEEEWIKDDPNCAFTLGLIYLERGEFSRAESHFRSSLRAGGDNPHAHRLLSQAIVLQIDEIILNNPPLRLSEEMVAKIDEAEEHLASAARIFEGYENPSRLYETLLQRAYVRGLRGNTTGSLADCDRILQAEPRHPEALRQKGHTLLSVGRTEEALRYFQEIEDEEERSAATLAAAVAHHREGRHNQVIGLLAQLWRPEDWTRQQAILADLLLSAYHHTGDANRVSALTDELQRVHPDDPEALAVLARQCMREGRADAALGNYTKALERAAPGNQHDRISIELAEYYFETEKWADAAEHFKGKVELSANNPLARKYLLSLYNAGARRAAMNLAKELRGSGEAIPFVSEVEAQVLAAAGDFDGALKLFRQLAEKQPEAVTHRLWAVEMLRGLKNEEEARATLEGIKLEEIKDDPTNLIRVAWLRQKLGMNGDLPFAYRARRVGFRDKDVHDAYVTLFMNHTSTVRGDLDVDCVAVDHAVRLKDRKGGYESYLIVEQEEYDPQHNEIPPSDPRAAKLLGLRVGDRVTFNEGRADEAGYEIAEVQSKYVYAFQQTIINYNHWFGGGGEGLLVMNVEGGDFSGLFRMLDQQAERGGKISSLYKERRMPLGALAGMMGRSLFEVWASLVSGEMKLFATAGELSEIQRATTALAGTEDVVVEISAVLTLQYLGLLDKLPEAFRRVIVASPVLKTVERWLAEAEGQKPHMTVWKERDQHYRQDITEEVITRRRVFLGEIKSFLEQHAEAVPAVKELDTPSEQLEQYKEALGEMATASLFVASDLGLPLHVDDMALNLIASDQRWRVQGVPTQVVLLRFKSRGLISEAEYYAALKRLILGNYAHVWITSAALWWMCVDEGKKATEAMRLILRATLGPESVPEPAFAIGSQLIHRVWMEVGDREEKLKLVDLVVEVLALGRDGAAVGAALKEILPKLFRYLPSALPHLLKRVDEQLSVPAGSGDNEPEETDGDGIRQVTTAG
jgi:tetratricopeptide (TPR) repeat protein